MGQILYYNGTILTMEDQKPCVEAVLTENGRITDAGTYKDLLERAGSQVRKGDLQGNVMVPGFIDPHSHFTACASNTMEVNLDGAENFDTIISRIQDFIRQRKIPEGQWVQASGYDHNCLKEHTHPRRMVLDQAAPRNPLIMKHQSGHMGVLNTMALNRLGITPDTVCPQGGVIEIKDKTITGYMEEAAFLKYQNQGPMPDKEEFLQAYSRAQELYASHGITTVQEGLLSQRLLPLYGLLAGSGLLKLDLVAYGDIRDSKTVTEQLKDHIRIYKNHIKLGGYKMFLDGSPQGRTAWMREPYEADQEGGQPKDYRGYGTLQDEEVYAHILKAEREGMQLLAHCNGDMACEQYLNQMEAVYGYLKKNEDPDCPAFYPGDIRPVMIHAQLLGLDQLKQVKRLKVIPSFFLAHVYHWGDVHIKNFGMERAGRISPAASALKEGIVFTLHQDSPVIRPDMMETLWCAVNRRTKGGVVLGGTERLPVWEALKAITVNGAYQYFEEDEKGSIVSGKKADFAVLDKNPLSTEPDGIRDIKVLATIKEDQLIWKRQ